MDGLLTLIKFAIVDYLIYALPVTLIELFSVFAGIYYLSKSQSSDLVTKYLVWFLGLTFLTEVIGTYAPVAYFSDYEYFGFVKDTPFEKNKWLYNCYSIIGYGFFPIYFGYYLKNIFWTRLLKGLVFIFVISSILNLIFSDVFYKSDSKFVHLAGTLLLLFSVALFYLELLRSNLILNLKRFLPMYISIGVFIFYLCITPLTIFSDYFNSKNNSFVELQVNMILYSNIFMYSLFILGFYICSRKKKSS